MKNTYQVIIKNSLQNPTGHIIGFDKNSYFNPLTILFELNFKNEELDLEDMDFDDFDYGTEYAFQDLFVVDNRAQYYRVVQAIKILLFESYSQKTCLNLNKVDFLRPYFDITFTLSLFNLIENPLKPFCPTAPDETVVPIHYSKYSMAAALKCNLMDCYEYFYDCQSLADIIYAILHFLALNKYSVNKCAHCGRYFLTKSYKTKYCPRNSPYPNFEHLPCEQAVKNIKQDINRKASTIYCNLQNNYPQDVLELFYKEYCAEYKLFRNEPSVAHINACYKVVDRERWYTKSRIICRGKKAPVNLKKIIPPQK